MCPAFFIETRKDLLQPVDCVALDSVSDSLILIFLLAKIMARHARAHLKVCPGLVTGHFLLGRTSKAGRKIAGWASDDKTKSMLLQGVPETKHVHTIKARFAYVRPDSRNIST